MTKMKISIAPVRTTRGLEWYARLDKHYELYYNVGPVGRYGQSKDEAVANLKSAFEELRLKATEEANLRQLQEQMEVDW